MQGMHSRLPGYDYHRSGADFVTLCTHRRELLFDEPRLRRVAEVLWQRIPRHYPHVQLDAWGVMPNHLHGIIVITDDPLQEWPTGAQPGSLGTIAGNFNAVRPGNGCRLLRSPRSNPATTVSWDCRAPARQQRGFGQWLNDLSVAPGFPVWPLRRCRLRAAD